MNNPFLFLSIILIVAEIWAGKLVPYLNNPDATQSIRNYYRYRGAPEYVSGVASEEGRHVIIITNSQGFAPELHPEDVYSNIIRGSLNEQGRGVTLENWAFGGLINQEMLALYGKALLKKPDLILIVFRLDKLSNLGWQDEETHTPLNPLAGTNDINLVLSDYFVYAKHSQMLNRKTLFPEDFFTMYFTYKSDLLRSRTYALDMIRRETSIDTFFNLYGRTHNGHKPPITRVQFVPFFKDSSARLQERLLSSFDPIYPETAKINILKFVDLLNEASKDDGEVKTIFISQPIALEYGSPDFQQNYNQLAAVAQKEFPKAVDYYDFTHFVPSERYYTIGHFDSEYHQLIAKEIEEIIINAIY